MFISNNRTSFHLWWKKNFVKHRKFSKCYETYCLEYFLLLFMFLLTAKLVKESHIYSRILCIFLQNILKQTCSSFNTKFEPQWKDILTKLSFWRGDRDLGYQSMTFRPFPHFSYFTKTLRLQSIGDSWGNSCISCLEVTITHRFSYRERKIW